MSRSIRSAVDLVPGRPAGTAMPCWQDERGSGLVGALAGMAMFAMLMLLAANVLLYLYASSTVTAVAFDAARTVAGAGGEPGARGGAVATARNMLSPEAVFDWAGTTDDAVRLRVEVPGPRLLAAPLLREMGLDRVSRTVVVRTERFRS